MQLYRLKKYDLSLFLGRSIAISGGNLIPAFATVPQKVRNTDSRDSHNQKRNPISIMGSKLSVKMISLPDLAFTWCAGPSYHDGSILSFGSTVLYTGGGEVEDTELLGLDDDCMRDITLWWYTVPLSLGQSAYEVKVCLAKVLLIQLDIICSGISNVIERILDD